VVAWASLGDAADQWQPGATLGAVQFGRAWPAGCAGGKVLGVDRLAAYPANPPISPGDLAATFYRWDRPQRRTHDRLTGRSTAMEAVVELFRRPKGRMHGQVVYHGKAFTEYLGFNLASWKPSWRLVDDSELPSR